MGGERTDLNVIWDKKLDLVMAWLLDLRERRVSDNSQISSMSNWRGGEAFY